jgi:hypothetical protein
LHLVACVCAALSRVTVSHRPLQVKGAHIYDYTDDTTRAAILDDIDATVMQVMSDSTHYPHAAEYLLIPPLDSVIVRSAFVLSRSMHRVWIDAYFSPTTVHRLIEVQPPQYCTLSDNSLDVFLTFAYDRAQCEEAAAQS